MIPVARQVDVLKRSLALIREGGWVRGKTREDTKHCAGEAIYVSFGISPPDSIKVLPSLSRVLIDRGFASLIHYNDCEGRTQDEIESMFEEAIERAVSGK